MTLEEIEKEIQHLATKADVANLKADLFKVILEGERGQRNLIFGMYGLIVLGIFVNHFWR